jgi:hypothetical protein
MNGSIIRREDRNRAAELIRGWLDGTVTNFDFEDRWPESSDRGVVEIGQQLWSYFDDFPEQRLTVENLDPEIKDLLIRCLDFLQTELPYQYSLFPKSLRDRI